MAADDTICALASGSLPSAIALVRVSGPGVRRLAEMHLPQGLPPARTATLTLVLDREGGRLDQAIVLFYAAPASFTGEDTLELMLHGGPAIVAAVLEAFTLEPDVRLAEPGEFTRRAFEHGKLDVVQAEAIADLIEAETDAQRDQALRQAGGALSDVYERWRMALVEAMAAVEVLVDFPDEGDVEGVTLAPARSRIMGLRDEIASALADDRIGERIRDGFRIALIGPPNAGKSSLLNRLARREAAIVSHLPGTTRDVVDVPLRLAGQMVWISDTAGLRDTADPVEAEGVARARHRAQEADLRLLVEDVNDRAPAEAFADILQPGDLRILNKSDLADEGVPADVSRETLHVSAFTGEGLAGLESWLSDWVTSRTSGREPSLVTRARHRAGLTAARDHLARALNGLDAEIGAELVAEDLRAAAYDLGRLVGRVDVEDILGSVFSSFCIGK